MIATMTLMIPIVLYWRFRYAMAPVSIASEISCISGVPLSFDQTYLKKYAAKITAMTAATGIINNRVSVPKSIILSIPCLSGTGIGTYT